MKYEGITTVRLTTVAYLKGMPVLGYSGLKTMGWNCREWDWVEMGGCWFSLCSLVSRWVGLDFTFLASFNAQH